MKSGVLEMGMSPRPRSKDWKACNKFGWCSGVEEIQYHADCPAEVVFSMGTQAGQTIKCECECHKV